MTGRYDIPPITAALVHAYRNNTGCGMAEAKSVLRTGRVRGVLEDLMENGTTEEKVDFLLARYAEGLVR